jgi:type IV pilus assembly protein PilE
MKNKVSGFTLIELLVVILIIGTIMAYAIPSYQRQVIVSKRTEAQNAILQIASAQEKHNATYNIYTENISGSGSDGDSLGLGTSAFITSTNYSYAVVVTAAAGYTITASARVGSTQVNDNFGVDCTSMSLNALGQKTILACWQ